LYFKTNTFVFLGECLSLAVLLEIEYNRFSEKNFRLSFSAWQGKNLRIFIKQISGPMEGK